MNSIAVSNIQRLCVNDGPGVRTVVFLRGCTLQCPWCCNPEAIHVNRYQVFDKGLCTYPEKKLYCVNCVRFGGEQQLVDCPVHAFGAVERQYTPEELLRVLLKDDMTYKNGGGVTFSGGEPLLQIPALLPILKALKAKDIHVAFETALYVPAEYIKLALPYVDYWIVDVKFQFGYVVNNDLVFQPMVSIEKNMQFLRQNVSNELLLYRMVWMHEAMKNAESVVQKLRENEIASIELLECHSLAENKYRQLGKLPRKFSAPTEDDMRIVGNLLKSNNIHFFYNCL